MRKHFLLLFLMALLPLSIFADDITITPMNASKTYGAVDPTAAGDVSTTWFSTSALPGGTTKTDVANALLFNRTDLGEAVGTYRYTYEDDCQVNTHNLMINGDGQFSIKQKALTSFDGSDNNKITFALKAGHEQYKDGSTQLKPTADDFTITVDLAVNSLDGVLVEGTDFVITNYGDNNNPAIPGTITIEGRGNYKGEKTFNFEIKGTSIAGMAASYTGANKVFKNADFITTDFDVNNFTVGDLLAGTDYEIKSVTARNAGAGTVVLQGIGSYSGEVSVGITIDKLAVNATTAPFAYTVSTAYDAMKYTGSEVAPVFTALTVNGYPLAETDYELTNLGTNAGNYTAKLKFKADGNFSGADQNIAYTIQKRTFNDGSVTVEFTKVNDVEVTEYPYSNQDIKPAYTVYFQPGGTVTKAELSASEYEFDYQGNADVDDLKNAENGKKLIITGKGVNFTTAALAAKTYDVAKREVEVGVEDFTVGMGSDVTPVVVYNTLATGHTAAGLAINPTVSYTLLDANGDETATVVTQANIKTAAVGQYNIHVNVAALNAQAAAAATDLKNYTFAEPTTVGVLNKIAGQVVVRIDEKTITYGDATPTTGWNIVYVSGLSDADSQYAAGTAFKAIKDAAVQAKFKVTGDTGAKLNANTTGYEVTYEGGSIDNASYAVTVLPGKLKVNKKLITDAMITIADAGTYTGQAKSPAIVSIKPGTATPDLVGDLNDMLPTNFYNTTYSSKYNAGDHMAHIFLSEAGKVNYTAESTHKFIATDPEVKDGDHATTSRAVAIDYVRKQYTIGKVALTIAADDFIGEDAWVYGHDEPSYSASLTAGTPAVGEEELINNFLAGQQPTGFAGKIQIKRTSANTYGYHADALEISFTNNKTANNVATNYNFTLVPGDLDIKKGQLVIKVKDATLAYGEAPVNDDVNKKYTFNLEAVSGLAEYERDNFNEIVTYSHNPADYGYVAAWEAIDGYTMTYAGAAPTATNYDITFANGTTEGPATGTLNVTKRPVKFYAKPQAIAYGTAFTPAVNATYVGQTITAGEYYSLLGTDDMNTVIASIAAASMNVGENAIVLTPKASDIYEIIVEDGVLTIGNTGIDIVLNRVVKASYDDEHTNTAAKLIADNDDKFVNVKFSDFPMIGEKWYPLVLPFATSVKDISAAFGYAVVDLFNGTSSDGKIMFKLHMGEIPANTPFIVKVYEDMNMADPTVAFNNVKIEDAMDDNAEVTIGDAAGVQFVGTYKGRVEGFRSNMYYFSSNAAYNDYYKGNDTNKTYLRPLGAFFVDNDANASTIQRVISIEEPNGTTEISAITVDGAFVETDGWYTTNGIRLQGVPTEKGVYIRNGKKIVIK